MFDSVGLINIFGSIAALQRLSRCVWVWTLEFDKESIEFRIVVKELQEADFFRAAAMGYEADNGRVTRMRARVIWKSQLPRDPEPAFRYKRIIGFCAESLTARWNWRRHSSSWIPRCCLNYRILNAVNIEYGRALHFLLALDPGSNWQKI